MYHKRRKCIWCDKGECELAFDNNKCKGTTYEMENCYIVANNAEYDNVEIEEFVQRWSN